MWDERERAVEVLYNNGVDGQYSSIDCKKRDKRSSDFDDDAQKKILCHRCDAESSRHIRQIDLRQIHFPPFCQIHFPPDLVRGVHTSYFHVYGRECRRGMRESEAEHDGEI